MCWRMLITSLQPFCFLPNTSVFIHWSFRLVHRLQQAQFAFFLRRYFAWSRMEVTSLSPTVLQAVTIGFCKVYLLQKCFLSVTRDLFKMLPAGFVTGSKDLSYGWSIQCDTEGPYDRRYNIDLCKKTNRISTEHGRAGSEVGQLQPSLGSIPTMAMTSLYEDFSS